jgi:LacI family transcriptional regulator
MKSRHGVSRPLVERMHSLLAEEGLVVREPGRGVFVAYPVECPKTAVIGCLSYGITHMGEVKSHRPYWLHLLEGISEAAHEAGFQVMMLRDSVEHQGWEKIDGLITTGHPDPRRNLPGLPCVSLLQTLEHIPSIVPDCCEGTRQAVEHLVSLGHERIGCLMFNNDSQSQRKMAGYLRGLRDAGIEPLLRWQRSLTEPDAANFDFRRSGERLTAAWLRDDWRELGLTALLVENDQTAIGSIAAFREAGLNVPNDVSIIGFDGTEISEYAHPTLTTVEVPLHEIGRRGVKELLHCLQAEHIPEVAPRSPILMPTQLRVRASTAAPVR